MLFKAHKNINVVIFFKINNKIYYTNKENYNKVKKAFLQSWTEVDVLLH